MRVGDRYEYDPAYDLLDKTGLGTVYRAIDTQENRVVALKCIPPELLPTHYELSEEINRVKYHSHANLVKYYEVFQENLPVEIAAIPADSISENEEPDLTITSTKETMLFHVVVMEYVEGNTLDKYPVYNLTEETLLHLLRDILQGLHYLHDHRIIHRDFRQSKIIVQEVEGKLVPKILYFGLSTQLSQFMPNYGYLPPERLGKYDDIITEMSDVWMFGVLVYELLTNQLPFGSTQEGLANDAIMINILSGQMIGEALALIPPYQEIVEKCLINDPQERYQKVAEILALLPDQAEEPKYSSFETTRGFGENDSKALLDNYEANDEEIYGTENYEQVTIGEPSVVPSLVSDEASEEPATTIREKSLLDTLDEETDFEEKKEKRSNLLLWIALISSLMLTLVAIYYLIKYDSTALDNTPGAAPIEKIKTAYLIKDSCPLYLTDLKSIE